jgi:hypothetical protein
MQLKNIKNKKVKIFEKPEVKDFADLIWKKILFTIFILLLVGTLGAVFLFTHISGVFDESLGDEANISSLILDKSKLDSALKFSEDKAEMLENSKQAKPQIIDPSAINSYSLEQPV